MKRRILINSLGASFAAVLPGCAAFEQDPDQEDTDYTDGLPDEFIFNVTVSDTSNEHLQIQGKEVNSTINQSYGKVELRATNQSESKIQSVDNDGFFSPEYRLKQGDNIDQMYLDRIETDNEEKELQPNAETSSLYNVEFINWMIGRDFSLDTNIKYEYEGEVYEDSFLIEASTKVE